MNTFWFSVSNKNTSVLGKILQNARFAVENKTDLIQTTPFFVVVVTFKTRDSNLCTEHAV